MKNIAIIDLGSNLTKLVVVSGELPLNVIHRSVYDTKTLKSAPTGYFNDISVKRIEEDIEKILSVAKGLDCDTHLGIATSAFRTRKNGQEVITGINKKFGINIQIIEGEREAHLISKGALASVTPKQFPVMVMDISGGSTEFIIGTETEILWKHSFDFGSTALTRDLYISDPLTIANAMDLDQALVHSLPSLFEAFQKHKPTSFIGTTGAFESFAQLIENAKGNKAPVQSGYEYSLPELNTITVKLFESTSKERTKMDGMNLLRVGTIGIAALILNHVLASSNFDNYYLSLGDVKEGLALEFLESNKT